MGPSRHPGTPPSRVVAAAFVALSLAACGGGGATRMSLSASGGPVPGYDLATGGLSCVPYARARSGIALRGDAWAWWDAAGAAGLPRGGTPRPGAVLVLDRSARLREGHLAVVARVVGPREVRVDHANWASAGEAGRGRVARDQPVLDASERGDWSRVRVWHPPSGALGATEYAARGFVGPVR